MSIVQAGPTGCDGPVAETLMRNGPIDELILWVHPVLVGVGTTDDMIRAEGVDAGLAVADVRTLGSGTLTYTAA